MQVNRARRAGLFCLSLAAIFTALWGWVPRAYAEDEPAAEISASAAGGVAGAPAGVGAGGGNADHPDNDNGAQPGGGKPADGTVGNADDKDDPGKHDKDGDANNKGHSCDGNKGIGQGNPAHDGCDPVCQPSQANNNCGNVCQPSQANNNCCVPTQANNNCGHVCQPSQANNNCCVPTQANNNCGTDCVPSTANNNCQDCTTNPNLPGCGSQQQLETQVLNNVIVRGPDPVASPAAEAAVEASPAAEESAVLAAAEAKAAAAPKAQVLGVQLARTGAPTKGLLTAAGIFLCLGSTLMLLGYKRQASELV